MSLLLRIARSIDWINERVGRSVMWLVLIAVVISAGNALARKLFNTSSNALLEIQWYLFAAIFMLPMAVLILWLSLPIVMSSIQSGEMSQNYGGLIRWPVKLLLPLGLGLLVLQALSELIKRIAFLTGHGPNPLVKKSAGAGTEELVAAIKANSVKIDEQGRTK